MDTPLQVRNLLPKGKYCFAKFAMARQDGEVHVRILDEGFEHDEIVRRMIGSHREEYVGAGIISGDGERLYYAWGSGACEREYGFSRPPDSREAETLLQELRDAVGAMLRFAMLHG